MQSSSIYYNLFYHFSLGMVSPSECESFAFSLMMLRITLFNKAGFLYTMKSSDISQAFYPQFHHHILSVGIDGIIDFSFASL